jgi:segregation and condensation protein A
MAPVVLQPIIAVVRGESLKTFPNDLYIPPDALRVFLETFQGPLDLLLYLIKKENMDILDIRIVEITRQYLEYIEVMQVMELNLAGEYLLMAATLAEIKSRLLLPRPESIEEEAEGLDPRAELIRRLQEYERFKNAAVAIDELPRLERDLQTADADMPKLDFSAIAVDVNINDILQALARVLRQAALYRHHEIVAEALSVRDRMSRIMSIVTAETYTNFEDLFSPEEGRLGIVVTLIALLELTRESILELTQSGPSAIIYVRAKVSFPNSEKKEIIPEDLYES